MAGRSFLIVHGLSGSGEGHWQRWLFEKLSNCGEVVYFPDFPSSYTPKLDEWIEKLDCELKKMTGEKIILCHSMGSVLWMHYSNLKQAKMVDRVLLVALPSKSAIEKLDIDKRFIDFELNGENIRKTANNTTLVISDGDEYCPEKASVYFGDGLKVNTIIFSDKAGHINIKSGYGRWDSVFEWCLDETVAICEKV